MTLEQLKDQLPEYAKDIKLNLQSLLATENDSGLTSQQIAGILYTSAISLKIPDIITACQTHAQTLLEEAHLIAAKTAATLMAMTNVYYRTVHLLEDKTYEQLPAKLRMMKLASPGIDKIDFELYSFAASVLGGCEMCVNAHATTLEKHGVTKAAIQSAIRLASLVNALATSYMVEHL